MSLEPMRLADLLAQWKALQLHVRHLQLVRDLCADIAAAEGRWSVAVSVNFDEVRMIAASYTNALRTVSALRGKDLQTEALAMIVGAAEALKYPEDALRGIVQAAIEDARDPVEP